MLSFKSLSGYNKNQIKQKRGGSSFLLKLLINYHEERHIEQHHLLTKL